MARSSAERPVPYLARLLIDRLHQRRGVGGRVLDLLIDHVRSLGADTLQLSWVEGPGSPAPFYLARGFEPTGEIDDGEIVARLDLARLDLTRTEPNPDVSARDPE
jgi:GNAT superfamily N-acetyltransferase